MLTVGHEVSLGMVSGVRLLSLCDNQQGCQSTVEGYGMAAATTAVGWSGWDVAVVLPVVSTADRRRESQDGIGLLFASDNQPGCQSTVEGYGLVALATSVCFSPPTRPSTHAISSGVKCKAKRIEALPTVPYEPLAGQSIL